MTSVDDGRVVRQLQDIPVVRDFTDVFPDELLGPPQVRDVEFRIDTDPYALPVSKAPYRMAPAELKELRLQLEDLLTRDTCALALLHGVYMSSLLKRRMVR